MTTQGEGLTEQRRLNEPEWEPKAVVWHRPGTWPEPGLYWFHGFAKFPDEVRQGRGFLFVVGEEAVGMLLHGQLHAAAFSPEELHGEWYGPFECPPWFGDAMDEPGESKEVGEEGEGI